MSEFVLKLLKAEGLIHMAAATNEQINDAEQKLGVSFFEEYREYLYTFGVASFYGHELTGICASPRLNVIDVTLAERHIFPKIPKSWYVVEEANIDGIVIWQSDSGEVFQASPGVEPVRLGGSLVEYLEL